LQAAVATLSVRNRVSRRDLAELCEELFGARISVGAIDAIVERAGDALADPYERLLEAIRRSRTLNVDETGWRLRGDQRTLWGAFTTRLAVFAITANRHEQHLRDLLADHQGVVTSDRWWAYNYLPLRRRQICWSHLQRDFQAHAEGSGAEHELGTAGLAICERVFWAWEVYQHTRDRRQLQLTIRGLRRELKPILRQYRGKVVRYKRSRGLARNLLKAWPALWTFAERPGVEPTNNHAERALRGAVIYRKLSLGSQSPAGERRVERLLSASISCRLQHRSLFSYLAELLATNARGDPLPQLA
jgi:transposase